MTELPEFPMTVYERVGSGPESMRFLCFGRLPERVERTDPETGRQKMVWRHTVFVPVWGATEKEAKAKFRAWVAEQREAMLKREMRVASAERARADNSLARTSDALSASEGQDDEGQE